MTEIDNATVDTAAIATVETVKPVKARKATTKKATTKPATVKRPRKVAKQIAAATETVHEPITVEPATVEPSGFRTWLKGAAICSLILLAVTVNGIVDLGEVAAVEPIKPSFHELAMSGLKTAKALGYSVN